MKPTVRFSDRMYDLVVGQSAIVWPIDHRNHAEGQGVSNTTWVITSPVVAIISADEFETANTHYVRRLA